MNHLPHGWTHATGSVLFELVTSGSRGWARYYADSGASFIRIGNLDHATITLDLKEVQHVHPPEGAEGQRTRLQPSDILISITAELGMVGLVPETLGEAYINQHVALARPVPGMNARYLAWFLASDADGKRQLQDMRRGATKAGLGLDDIRSVRIPLAPLSEQKRIADKLDTLLTQVAACRERLDRVPNILKRFRQSVLAAATSGELTREWRSGVAPEWQRCTIAELLREKPRNGFSPRAVEHVTPVKSLTLTATTSGRFRAEHYKYIEEDIPADSYLWLHPNDVLVQRANTLEYVGVSAVYDGPPAGFIYPDLMMKCRTNDKVLPGFLWCLLSSESVRTYFRDNATGTAGNMPKINQKTVMSAPAVVPPIEEQQEIVRRVDELYSFADLVDGRHVAALRAIRDLSPAILAKAFRGELVPQDPNDEPASELLARIRAARAAEEKTKPKRKTSTMKAPDRAMLTRSDVESDHLTAILQERGALSAEALWHASQLDIDEFYEQLKEEEAQGLLRERPGKGGDDARLLEPAA